MVVGVARHRRVVVLVLVPEVGRADAEDSARAELGLDADAVAVALVPDKWLLSLFYRYQKVDGNNDFSAGALARPATTGPVEDIAKYDDTEINHFSGQLKWTFAPSWAVALGGWWEKYEYNDDQTGQTLYYMPASFFLNPVNGNYDGWVSYLNLTYKF